MSRCRGGCRCKGGLVGVGGCIGVGKCRGGWVGVGVDGVGG